METRANYVRVGIFTLVVLALAVGFVYWSVFSASGSSRVPLLVRIEGSVSGLQQGSQVLFNGLPVGQVTSLRLDPNNPKVVVATTEVDPGIPIKDSTQANIGFQGLTGVGFIELKGGNVDQPNIIQVAREQGVVPIIKANPSDVTDILATARDIADRANNILGQFQTIVDAVGPSVKTTADNITKTSQHVETVTAALSAKTGEIDSFLNSLGQVADSAKTVAQALPGAIGDARNILQAVDPTSVKRTVDNVASISDTLRKESGNVADVVESVKTAANSVGEVGKVISRNTDGIDHFLNSLGPLSDTATQVAGRLDTTLQSANQLVAAVDPKEVESTLKGISTTAQNVADLTTSIGSQKEAINSAISGASHAVQNVNQITTTVAQRSGDIDKLLKNLAPLSETATRVAGNLDTAVQSANRLVTAVDPAKVSSAVDGFSSAATDVSGLTKNIAAQQGTIDAAISSAANAAQNVDRITQTVAKNNDSVDKLLANLGPISDNVGQASAKLNQTLDTANQAIGSANQVVAAVDPKQVKATLDNVSSATADVKSLTDTLGAQKEAINSAISGASHTIQNVNQITTTVAQHNGDVDKLLASLGPISDNVGQASAKLNQTLDSAQGLVNSVNTDKINNVIDNVQGITAAVNAKSPQVQSIIDGVDKTVRTLNTAIDGFSETRAQVDTLLASIDPGKVNRAVDNVSAATDNVAKAADSIAGVADSIGQHKQDINDTLANAKAISATLREASKRVDSVLASLNTTLAGSGDGTSLGADVASAARAVRTAANSINAASNSLQAEIKPIAANIQQFSGQGLKEVQSLASNVSQSVSRIQDAITSFSNDPSRLIYGGDQVKQFNGRTRH
ncbi:MlaD family protein [Jiella sp. M17.18]|uniref:MlaD family protein n=1 Tax=Jiella sp. M17.18 TaxID=3234247 RepID=UPI0034DE8EEA